MSREVAWVNYGIDGACCYLIMRWLRGKNLEVRYTTAKRFRDDFIKWQIDAGVTHYAKIFVLGIDISKCIDAVDIPNAVVIDHHDTHAERKHLYNNARVAITTTTSTSRLLFRLFRDDLLKQISPAQIRLISMVNDHVGDIDQDPQSQHLNALYWSYAGDRLQKFVQDFEDGFKGFSSQQRASISLFNKKLANTINGLEIFQGNIPFRGTNNQIVGTFATNAFDDISKHLLVNHQADIAFIVNMDNRTIFMKKSQKCQVPLAKLAERLCDGGGSNRLAGGIITDRFLEFCKTLQKIC